MSCMLKVYDNNFDVEAFLSESKWDEHDHFSISRKGKPISLGTNKLLKYSGFSFEVSNTDFKDFNKQQNDVTDFIEKNRQWFVELLKLSNRPRINFGIEGYPENDLYRTYRLDKRLVALCAEFDIEIDISTYFPARDEE